MGKPTAYPLLEELKDGTELYTQRPDAPDDPGNFRFTAFMVYQYILKKLGSFSSAPQRISYPVAVSGNTIGIPSTVVLPVSNARIYVYRDGRLIAWNRGVTRVGNVVTFTPPLDEEYIEFSIFN